jgi:hypothetical protein
LGLLLQGVALSYDGTSAEPLESSMKDFLEFVGPNAESLATFGGRRSWKRDYRLRIRVSLRLPGIHFRISTISILKSQTVSALTQ